MSTLISNLNLIESCKLDIKSALEAKGVDMTGVSFPGYATAIENIPAGGGYTLSDVIENNTSQYLYDSTVDVIPQYGLTAIKTIVYRNGVTNIIEKDNSEKLISVDFPICSIVNEGGFCAQHILESVNLPSCKNIFEKAFLDCYSLQSLNIPNCTYIDTSAFRGCYLLPYIDLPYLSAVGRDTFLGCTSLSYASLPQLKEVIQGTFSGCTSLSEVYIPIATKIGLSAFTNCTSLSHLELNIVTYISSGAFNGCINLSSLTINTSTLCSLSTKSAFTSTPIAAGTGYIYVPASLVSDYKVAAGWSSVSNQIYPISGPTPTPELAFNNGLLYGSITSMNSGYITDYNLGIDPTDVTEVSLPDCLEIGESTFISHTNISSVYLPSVTSIQNTAFKYDIALQSIDLPVCEHIGFSAFLGCDLLSISAPLLDDTGSFTFGNNYNLSYVDLPALSIGGQGTFNNCYALSSVSLPLLSDIGIRMFDHCDLRTITLPAAQTIRVSAFNSNSQLSEVYLPGSTVCGLAMTGGVVNEFNGTPIADGTGYVYVPASLLTTYQNRAAWATYSTQLRPIGGYPELSFEDGYLYGSISTNLSRTAWMNLGASAEDIIRVELPDYDGLGTHTGIFSGCVNLVSVSMPQAEQLGMNDFSGCTSLTRVYIPNCTSLFYHTFGYCSSLSTLDLPMVDFIDDECFWYAGLESLTLGVSSICGLPSSTAFAHTPIWSGTGSIYVPSSLVSDYKAATNWSYFASQIFPIGYVPGYLSFDNGLLEGNVQSIASTYITDFELGIDKNDVLMVSLPDCVTVNGLTFRSHANLSSVDLPNCTTIANQAFFSCSNLETISIPLCEEISTGAFRYCSALQYIILPNIKNIWANAFANCIGLNTVQLGGSQVATLSNNGFLSTSCGFVVPASLYADYIVADNWSLLSDRIFPDE